MSHDPGPAPSALPSALPSSKARLAAFAAILVGGISGALIGYAFADLQCTGDCSTVSGVSALAGGALAAAGVAVISVLVLRAMVEWRRVQAGGSSPRT